jgi:hypothetical protein
MVPFAGNEFERSRRSGKMTRVAVVAVLVADRGGFASAGAIDTEQNRIDIHSSRRVNFFR